MRVFKMNSKCFWITFLALLFCTFTIANQQNVSKESKHTSISSQIYVFGGFDGIDGNGGIRLSSASHFNSSTGKWKSTTDLSIARNLFCGAVVGTKIYLFGGTGRLKIAEVYDSETGTYSQYRSLPGPRQECAAAVLNGFIYVAGGWDGTNYLSSVIRYNIRTTRQEDVTPMRIAKGGFELIALAGRLYAVGSNFGNSSKIVEVYNPGTNQWTTVASMNYQHSFFGATVHEGRIYVCSQNGFEVYSPDIDQWTILSSPNKFRGRNLVSMNNRLWALGGGEVGASGTKSVLTYDTFTEKWSVQPDMDVARQFHSSFVVNQ